MVKSILGSIYIYWLAYFLLPIRTVYEINRLCRIFLGNGLDSFTSHGLIGWEDICYPMDEGGLGVTDLVTINKVSILRHVLNIVRDKNIMWVEWIKKDKINVVNNMCKYRYILSV